jgi:hypothetical protein
VGPKSAEKIIASVKDYYMQFAEASSAENQAEKVEVPEEQEAQNGGLAASQEQSEAAVDNTAIAEEVQSSSDIVTEPDHEIDKKTSEEEE